MEAAQWPGLVTNRKPTPAYNYGKHLSKNPNKHHAQSTPSSDSALAHLPGVRKQGPPPHKGILQLLPSLPSLPLASSISRKLHLTQISQEEAPLLVKRPAPPIYGLFSLNKGTSKLVTKLFVRFCHLTGLRKLRQCEPTGQDL